MYMPHMLHVNATYAYTPCTRTYLEQTMSLQQIFTYMYNVPVAYVESLTKPEIFAVKARFLHYCGKTVVVLCPLESWSTCMSE